MISELSGAELKKTLNEILNEMDKHDFKNMNNSKPKKKTYCIAITTKDKMCRNYAWSKCEEQLCYSLIKHKMAKYELFKTIIARSTELDQQTKNSIIKLINENAEEDEDHVIGLVQECILNYVNKQK